MTRTTALLAALLWTTPGLTQPLPADAPPAAAPAAPEAPSPQPQPPPRARPPAATEPDDGRMTVALLKLDGNAPGLEQAPAVGALLASQLADAPRLKLITQADISTLLGLERERQLFKAETCAEDCMVELSGAIGARYVLSGRLDRFGPQYVLTMTLFDSIKTTSLSKPRAEAATDGELPAAARKVAGDLLSALGVSAEVGSPPRTSVASRGTGLTLSLKGGSGFLASLRQLSPRADLELGYRFLPEWLAFLQVGFAFVSTGDNRTLNLVPSVIGVRRLYRIDTQLQPYWGLGLGVQLSFARVEILSAPLPLPTIVGLIGVQYMFFDQVGVVVEGGTNVAQMLLGLLPGGEGSGVNLDLRAGFVFRF